MEISVLSLLFQHERGMLIDDSTAALASVCRGIWDDESTWSRMSIIKRGRANRTHLMYAAMTGNAKRVEWILKNSGGVRAELPMLILANNRAIELGCTRMCAASLALINLHPDCLRLILDAYKASREYSLSKGRYLVQLDLSSAIDTVLTHSSTYVNNAMAQQAIECFRVLIEFFDEINLLPFPSGWSRLYLIWDQRFADERSNNALALVVKELASKLKTKVVQMRLDEF